jgi:hypothetical protein
MLLSVAVAVSSVVTAAFLLEPLVRDEEDLKPLDRRRERGRSETELEVERMTVQCCRHCGRNVNGEYAFCGGCARPVA